MRKFRASQATDYYGLTRHNQSLWNLVTEHQSSAYMRKRNNRHLRTIGVGVIGGLG